MAGQHERENGGTVSSELLQMLSECITAEWLDIGRSLKISDPELHNIKSDYSDRRKEAIYQMLLSWKCKEGSEATHEVLAKALKAAKRVDLAEEVTKSKLGITNSSSQNVDSQVSLGSNGKVTVNISSADLYIKSDQVRPVLVQPVQQVVTYQQPTTKKESLPAKSKPTTWKGSDGCIHQYPVEVTSFSSHYGQEECTAYIASNLAGPSTIYPEYSDSSRSCVFRTYGPWWDMVPSAISPFSNSSCNFYGMDFVDLKLETPVIPWKIRIFETYYPQGVIQIYGAMVSYQKGGICPDVRWHKLWEDEVRESIKETIHEAIVFDPEITIISESVNVIRLIISSKSLEYYTELDAVEIIEVEPDCSGTVLACFCIVDLDIEYKKRLQRLSLGRRDTNSNEHSSRNPPVNYFQKLSEKLILLILSKLGFQDLCRVAQTCTLLKKHCYNPSLFQEVDMQPYWRLVTSEALDSLRITSRVCHLQKLSVSWCSYGNNVKFAAALASLIKEHGTDLRVLRIQGCSFTLDETLLQVAANCQYLEELNLSSSRNVNNSYLCLSHLHSLTRLDMYRACPVEGSMTEILKANPNLQHLNLGNTRTITEFDRIALTIGNHCKNIVSLNLWRAYSLSSNGLNYISQNCIRLEELDIGWCDNIDVQSDCFVTLVKSCSRLKKLFLTAIRHTRDKDIYAFAEYGKCLQFLDIMGAFYVHPSSISNLLKCSRRLLYLDVSYCNQISRQDARFWQTLYTNVNIKRGYMKKDR
ncbi:F-box/LRR-repeat protein 4 [Holothuria leucospilota]|uniref:F-box/LRR-repeat protein 4 n=1 Tax=Holothuria leucospilota TaxID=206669 RepID=A0A9Q0YNE1_HOLLE|nr:F-box/LRR-repeat protein 4 [Holothuria leucospilota]